MGTDIPAPGPSVPSVVKPLSFFYSLDSRGVGPGSAFELRTSFWFLISDFGFFSHLHPSFMRFLPIIQKLVTHSVHSVHSVHSMHIMHSVHSVHSC